MNDKKINLLQECSFKEILLWMVRSRRRCRVAGPSMCPLLRAGDEVLVDFHAYRRRSPRVDDIVIARHPVLADLKVIKRIKGINEDGQCHLLGDNPDSAQNSSVLVPFSLILGQVTSRF